MTIPQLSLRTFGPPAVARDGVPIAGLSVRRRPLALLAFVASHGDAGVARDRVLATLWPESSEDRARNSLKQASFTVRQLVGDGVLLAPGTTLRVDRALLAVDRWDFMDAAARGDVAAAAALYAGPFLDGLSFPGLDDFERWAAEERARLARAAAAAFEGVARRSARDGDHAAAIAAWRRCAGIDPYDVGAAAGLMRALWASGAPTGALEHWRVHRTLVREELGAEPSPALRALADAIRGALAGALAETPHPALAPAPLPASLPAPLPAPRATASVEPPDEPAPAQFPRRLLTTGERRLPPHASRRVQRVRGGLVALGVAVVAVAGLLALAPARARLRAASTGTVAAAMPVRVAVLPFSGFDADTASAEHLGRALADLLAVALDGTGPWRVVAPSALPADARARAATLDAAVARATASRLAADGYVRGDVVREGSRLHALASVHDPDGRVVLQASAEGATVAGAADALARALVARRFLSPSERTAHVAASTAASAPALRAWLDGERAARAGRLGEAAASYAHATALDSSFAL
ncbi:BTAD domain-containing putative transcriptional regulator, partial [Roseisolibacter sp. H3M3-2]|uniref:AfsR/SARP family transcriptional regulator n=1 Tax=Roseisolibacter sp. H3M3-2 TaxID=3031323 RepID=UPI0023DA3237